MSKAIEKLALQLYAARSTIKRFQETENEIAAELKPKLVLAEPLVFSGIKVELIQVQAHAVAGYEVPACEKITIGPSAMLTPEGN